MGLAVLRSTFARSWVQWLIAFSLGIAATAFVLGWITIPEIGPEVAFNGVVALGTSIAVIVAVWSGHKTAQEAEKDRKEARQIQKDRDAQVASSIAIALDHELYMLGAGLAAALKPLRDAPELIADNPRDAMESMWSAFPRSGMSLMTRFADQFYVFGPKVSSDLLIVMGQFNFSAAMEEFPEGFDGLEPHMQRALAGGLLGTFDTLIRRVVIAREGIRPHSAHYAANPAVIDY